MERQLTTATLASVTASPAQNLDIVFRNCNCIGEGQISLRLGSLNVKYGSNGIGKSTISRALALVAENGQLDELTPFKHRSQIGGPRPSVEGAAGIKSVMTFNDAYVSQFVFQRDEVIRNSFEIFINTEDYRAGLGLIESMFKSLKETFDTRPELDEAIRDFSELRDAFNLTKGKEISKASRGYKAIPMGHKLIQVPEELIGFEGFLRSDDPASWVTWQEKGNAYLELSDNCPFCSTPDLDKLIARKVAEEYNSAAVRNMSSLRRVIERLGIYFEDDARKQLTEVITSITGPSKEQDSFLAKLCIDVETFLSKLSALRGVSFHGLKDESDITQALAQLNIDLNYLPALDSTATRSVVQLINEQVDGVASKIDDIRRHVGMQKGRVERLIQSNQKAINEFLAMAGYRYQVRIEERDQSYRMILEHLDTSGHIDAPASHLSYGEKNAFALVLFTHDAKHKKPDLVILDDPVSSFDKTKKFAILDQLFRSGNGLRNQTTLLLTHDIEPAIDIVLMKSRFTTVKPVVHFLSARSGHLHETPIEKSDIQTFSSVCRDSIESSSDPIIKCIYLRRLLEVDGTGGDMYEILSNLLHARETPYRKLDDGQQKDFSIQEIMAVAVELQQHIPGFNYRELVDDLRTPGTLEDRIKTTSIGYEKVQLFRILTELNPAISVTNPAFTKFVNETFHIENEYLMQLSPSRFDTVPDFILETCDELISNATARASS